MARQVLVVDDEPGIRCVLRGYLEAEGLEDPGSRVFRGIRPRTVEPGGELLQMFDPALQDVVHESGAVSEPPTLGLEADAV